MAPPKVSARIRRSVVRLDSPVIDETPILGRKSTTLPLLNSAFRQGKGTAISSSTRRTSSPASGRAAATTFTLDGANNDEGWGRQTAIATVPDRRDPGNHDRNERFSSEFGWTTGPALNIVTKSGTNDFHGEGLFLLRPGGVGRRKTFSTRVFARRPCRPASRLPRSSILIQWIFRTRCSRSRLDRWTDHQGEDLLLRHG
jgi:hypothetical protein